jgi:ATP-dependent Clp protease protease subunit
MANSKMTSRSWFTAMSAATGAAEIDIYDEIGMFGVTALDFNRELRALGAVSEINLRINSPGGEVFDGIAIYNILRRHKAKVNISIDGIAASIASVIAMAGDTVSMPANAMMMIHDPSGVVVGTSKDMRDLSDALDKVKASMVATYASKSNLSSEEIEKIMSDETWLTAEEAVEFGFADVIEAPIAMAACFDLSARYKSVPKGLAALNTKETPMPKENSKPIEAPIEAVVTAPIEASAEEIEAPLEEIATEIEAPIEAAPIEAAPVASASDPVAAERQRASDILATCSLAGLPDRASGFIASGASLSAVVAVLQDARATAPAGGAGNGSQIIARQSAPTEGAPALRVDLVAEMRKRAGMAG